MNQKYNKRKLWLFLIKELNHSIHNSHVYSIINILIDEIIKDLLAGKKIKIINFGTLFIKELKPRAFLDFFTREVKMSGKSRTLRFKISKNLSKFINSVKICDKDQ